jgi:hypothetical protein
MKARSRRRRHFDHREGRPGDVGCPPRPSIGPCVALLLGAAACGSVPNDPGPRVFPAAGVIRGTVVYRGPRPCSRGGHVVGNAVILVFDRNDPPPPAGLATTAVNLGDVTGDVLFANEPRYTGNDVYCPAESGFPDAITASAPFVISSLPGGSYEIQAFFDYTGNFLPEFETRNLPERGDVAGGTIDTTDLDPDRAQNANYRPRFVPVDVGIAGPGGSGFVIPKAGFVADDVTVTLGLPLPTTRPYFYPQGEVVTFDPNAMTLSAAIVQSSDAPATDPTGIAATTQTVPDDQPILTIAQDIQVLAPPTTPSPASEARFESGLPHIVLRWGVPDGELASAKASPFRLQVAPFGPGAGFAVWQNAIVDATSRQYVPQEIPEGSVPELWPRVLLTRIVDGAGGAPGPVVVIAGITLLETDDPARPDSMLATAAAAGSLFGASGAMPVVRAQDRLSVVLRPSAVCISGTGSAASRTTVTPHPTAPPADVDCSSGTCVPAGGADAPIAPGDLGKIGCLPTGRYAINVVYPDGQAWTVPNEAGVCAVGEGASDFASARCTGGPRPLLYSQGNRAVVEVVRARDPAFCLDHPVPAECVNGGGNGP